MNPLKASFFFDFFLSQMSRPFYDEPRSKSPSSALFYVRQTTEILILHCCMSSEIYLIEHSNAAKTYLIKYAIMTCDNRKGS